MFVLLRKKLQHKFHANSPSRILITIADLYQNSKKAFGSFEKFWNTSRELQKNYEGFWRFSWSLQKVQMSLKSCHNHCQNSREAFRSLEKSLDVSREALKNSGTFKAIFRRSDRPEIDHRGVTKTSRIIPEISTNILSLMKTAREFSEQS